MPEMVTEMTEDQGVVVGMTVPCKYIRLEPAVDLSCLQFE